MPRSAASTQSGIVCQARRTSPAKVGAPIGIHYGLDVFIGELILLADATTDGVGHAALRPAVNSSGDRDAHGWIMADAGINTSECLDESAILANRDGRYATSALKRSDRDGKTGAWRFRVPGPRISRVWIEPFGNSIEKFR